MQHTILFAINYHTGPKNKTLVKDPDPFQDKNVITPNNDDDNVIKKVHEKSN